MDQRDIFIRLSLYPFSYSSLEKFNNASLALRRRYPGLEWSESEMPNFNVLASHQHHPFSVPLHWQNYKKKNNIQNLDLEKHEHSIVVSLCDEDNLHLEKAVVEKYLKLLQTTFENVEIRDIRTIGNTNSICDEGLERTSIIPFHTKNNWAFAVVYWDCIHWFESAPGAPVPHFSPQDSRHMEVIWTGPKHSHPTDSGIFMLLGIRQILSGKPHLEKVSQAVVNDFRCLMFIELLCNKINPTEDDFRNLPQGSDSQSPNNSIVDENMESYFDNAIHHVELPGSPVSESSQAQLRNSTVDANVVSVSSTFGMRAPDNTAPYLVDADSGEAGSNVPSWHAQQEQQYGDPESVPDTANFPEAQSINPQPVYSPYNEPPLGNTHVASETPPLSEDQPERSSQRRSENGLTQSSVVQRRQRSRRQRMQMQQKDDRMVILELLSEAFVACRSRKALRPTDLFFLWKLVDKGAVTSTFFQRYYSVCFWEETKDLQDTDLSLKLQGISSRKIRDRMMSCRKECKLWWDLCNLWNPNDPENPKKYTMCAIPLGDTESLDRPTYNLIKKRLENAADDLRNYLRKAEDLCLRLTQDSLPEHLLMIQNFLFKTKINLDRDFEMFVSLVSRPRISLPSV